MINFEATPEERLRLINSLIPEGYKVVVEQEEDLTGERWNLKQVATYYHRSEKTICKQVLFPYRDILDINNGGFIRYSKGNGSPWEIDIKKLKKFIDQNKIFMGV